MRYDSPKFKAEEDVRSVAIIMGTFFSAVTAWPMMNEWMGSPRGFGDAAFLFTWWPVAGYVAGWWSARGVGGLGHWFVWDVLGTRQLPWGVKRRFRVSVDPFYDFSPRLA